MNKLNAVRSAIFEVFGDFISDSPERTKEIINKATFTGADDPGQWSPKADVIAHTESGIPNPCNCDGFEIVEMWFEVDKVLKEKGVELYHESINGAVIGFYKG